jgi:hypothetical protein
MFIAGRGAAARDLNLEVASLLSDLETSPEFDKGAVNQQFIQYVEMIVVINELHSGLVEEFGPTILKMLGFQLEKKLGGTLTGSLAMSLQLKEGTFNEVLRAALILEAASQKRRTPPATSRHHKRPPQKKPLLVFYLFDLGYHPLAYLVVELLSRILKNGRVEVYILVMRKAQRCEYADFMEGLKKEFSKRRWKEFNRTEAGGNKARALLRRLDPTIFVDLVGNMHGQLDYFPEPWYGRKVVHYLNTGCKILDLRYHDGVFDWGMLDGMPADWGDGSGEGGKALSLWQSALPGFLLDKVDRSIKHSSGGLNLFIHVNLDRRGDIFALGFEILLRLKDARLHFQANPLSLVPVILELARKFEKDNSLLAGTIESRTVAWRFQRMEKFIGNLRSKEVHLLLSGGPYPAHTGQAVGMGAGLLGLTVPYNSMMNRVPRNMNSFVGTGALNPLDRQDAFDLILFLNANRHILDAVQVHYDDLARKRKFIFDPDRAVKDFEAMAFDVFGGGNETSFCKTEPLEPILEVHRDAAEKLERITVLEMGGHRQGEQVRREVHSSSPLRLQAGPHALPPGVHFFGRGGPAVITPDQIVPRRRALMNTYPTVPMATEDLVFPFVTEDPDVAGTAAPSASLEILESASAALLTRELLEAGAQIGLREEEDLQNDHRGAPGGGGA